MVHKLPKDEDEEIPHDLKGYFGHPLNSYCENSNGALALLHEYRSLPAIDKCDTDSPMDSDMYFIHSSSISKENDSDEKFAYSPCVASNDALDFISTITSDESSNEQLQDVIDHSFTDDTVHYSDCMSKSEINSQISDATDIDCKSGLATVFAEADYNVLDGLVDTKDLNNNAQTFESISEDSLTKLEENQNGFEMGNQNIVAQSSPIDIISSKAVKLEIHQDFNDTIINTALDNTPKVTNTPSTTFTDNFLVSQSSTNEVKTTQSQPDVYSTAGLAVTSYAAVPQVMPVQLIQTPNGPVHYPTYFQGGNICLTPYPQQPQGKPIHPMMHPASTSMNMHWGPPCYSYMPYRAMHPDKMRMTSPIYYAPLDVCMMRPAFQQQLVHPPSILVQNKISETGQMVCLPQLPNNMPVCKQIEFHQQLSKRQQEQNLEAGIDQRKRTLPYSIDIARQEVDTLEQACVLTQITQPSRLSPGAQISSHLQSPDSGIGEHQSESSPCESDISVSNPSSPLDSSTNSLKRHQSSCLSRQNSMVRCRVNSTSNNSTTYYQKRDDDITGYKVFLEAPTSCSARLEDDRMTYLNKGQYYVLNIKNSLPPNLMTSTIVKSVVMVKFRDESKDAALKMWRYWYSRQTEGQARSINIDAHASEGVVKESIEHIGVNGFAIRWDPRIGAKVSIAVNCLSTDFSPQKGVKGQPLHIQVDTYDDVYSLTSCPIHRAYAQIKIFCDKGAERKTRDEGKKKDKCMKSQPDKQGSTKMPLERYHEVCEQTDFYSMADLVTEAYIHSPSDSYEDFVHKDIAPPDSVIQPDSFPSLMDSTLSRPPIKKQKLEESDEVLIYVKEEEDTIFHSLLVKERTLQSLIDAILEKYSNKTKEIKLVYKKIKKIYLARIDDNYVKYKLKNESAYCIHMSTPPNTASSEIVLEEIEL